MAEVIVYQASTYAAEQRRTAVVRSVGSLFTGVSRILAVLGLALILFSVVPGAVSWVSAQITPPAANFRLSPADVKLLTVTGNVRERTNQPPLDPTLPLSNHLTIPSIGVDTDIQEAPYNDFEEALKKGVWRVSDFGAPPQEGTPVILAAHRFGYLAWTNEFRYKNSFFNLPKMAVGDMINIIWRQRKYTYVVYATDKSDEIKDYTADLILYTCETLTGPERIFVYARLVNL